ncbi:MAG: T9SS C-terminal target domain-containing protein [Haliscomenobacteraceae bacterium CHB4]|nr:hypothetical protein [Saprospiraceae bacterium]MCE7923433.1 T9SS C-terminal target domain-containing protein [Haliscomenobacteraceae bacterium CHB4]
MKSLHILFIWIVTIIDPIYINGQFSISGTILTDDGKEVTEAKVFLINGLDSTVVLTDAGGHYLFENVTGGNDYVVKPFKKDSILIYSNSNDLNRQTTHILGLDALTYYRYIASDLNGNNTVTGLDQLLLHRALLGDIDENSYDSWRFIPESFNLPQNPEGLTYPESIQVLNLNQNLTNQNFIGIRMGDLTPNDTDTLLSNNDTPQLLFKQTPYQDSKPLLEFEMWAYNFEQVESFQIRINWDSLLLDSIMFENGDFPFFDISINKYKKKEPKGNVTFVWFKTTPPNTFNPDTVLLAKLFLNEKCLQDSISTNVGLTNQIYFNKSAALYIDLKEIQNAAFVNTQTTLSANAVANSEISFPTGNQVADIKINIEEFSSGDPPYLFQWSNGTITEESSITLPYGTYFCTVTDANGCTTVLGPLEAGESNINAGSSEKELEITIAPNPSSDYLFIRHNLSDTEYIKIELLNTIGNIVLLKVADTFEKQFQVDTFKLPPGLYQLLFRTEKMTRSFLIVLNN